MNDQEILIGELEKICLANGKTELDFYKLAFNIGGYDLVTSIEYLPNLGFNCDRVKGDNVSHSAKRIRDSILCLEGGYGLN